MATNMMSNYSYGEDCFEEMDTVLAPYHIKSVVLLGGKRALKAAEDGLRAGLKKAGVTVTGAFVYGKNSTQATIDRWVSEPEVQRADAVFGIGGGKALDTAKMVAKELGRPVFTVPTICSNCSAGTAIAVIYHEDHTLKGYGFPEAPLHMFINTKVIAEAPEEYFWAGIGDGMSKAPEVEHAVEEAVKRGQELDHTGASGLAIATSTRNAFYTYGAEALQDVKENRPSNAVEQIALDILVSTGYASNLTNQPGKYYYNSCHAHAFYNGSLAVEREGEFLHGAVVSFGVLVLHAYFDEEEELAKNLAFNKSLGLPTTLADLNLTEDDIPAIIEASLKTNEYRQTPYDKEQYAAAIRRVDAAGRALNG